jgi:hypothetical protein
MLRIDRNRARPASHAALVAALLGLGSIGVAPISAETTATEEAEAAAATEAAAAEEAAAAAAEEAAEPVEAVPVPASGAPNLVGPAGVTGVLRRAERRDDYRQEEKIEDLKELDDAIDRKARDATGRKASDALDRGAEAGRRRAR